MTVSSTTRMAQFAGNGSAATFAFAFMVFEPSDVVVIETNNTTGAEVTKVLNTDYSVLLNANQAVYPGGTVLLTAGPLAAGYTAVITSAVPETQSTDLTNSGGFYPEVITAALDRLTILAQQLQQAVNQALSIPVGDPTTISTILPPAQVRAGTFLSFDENGAPQANILAPSGISIGYGETIATAGQTVFNTPQYKPGANNLLVVCGGLLLTNGLDYTETTSQTITLTQASDAGAVYTFRVLN
jgi:hypothetical protein